MDYLKEGGIGLPFFMVSIIDTTSFICVRFYDVLFFLTY